MNEKTDKAEKNTWRTATASRLAAVQALYQVDLETATYASALSNGIARGAALDEHGLTADVDQDLITAIVRGVAADEEGRLDEMIGGALSTGWTVQRLEALMRAILRAGIHELMENADVPARVIINDYVDIAHSFYARGEPGMVNAILDRLARILRAHEFTPETAAGG
jgi:N utilization substance protein B